MGAWCIHGGVNGSCQAEARIKDWEYWKYWKKRAIAAEVDRRDLAEQVHDVRRERDTVKDALDARTQFAAEVREERDKLEGQLRATLELLVEAAL